ncbi:MAG TPA: TIGR03618 family F420-dependent PPOX class oxidoreductase [Nitrososphaeraceae archaeon]|nr:TIGR03618 family F420-dependent PPOX class oxidoreductase [Nitrososphaeraceae archaeon]
MLISDGRPEMYVQNDEKHDLGKMPASAEIVDVAPPNMESDSISKSELLEGVTELNKDDLPRLFQFRNLAYVGTLSNDGSPHITPVWAEMVEDLILINTFEESAKIKHISKDKRIALSVVEQNNPFNMVSIKGRVVEQTSEGADEHLKRLAKRYLGIGKYYYRKPNHKRVILKIKPEKIMGLSIHPAFYFLAYSPWLK